MHRFLVEVTPGSSAPSILLGTKNQCRFCSRHRNQMGATFNKKAHVIPQALSAGHEVLSREECDQCNEWASVHESDLSAFLAADRLAFMMRGSKPTVSVLPSLAITPDARHLEAKLSESLSELTLLPGRLGYRVNLPMRPFRRSGIARAVLRMGLFVAPRELIKGPIAAALCWLRTPGSPCPVSLAWEEVKLPLPTARLAANWLDESQERVGHIQFTYGTHCISLDVWHDTARGRADRIIPDGEFDEVRTLSFEYHPRGPFCPPTDAEVARFAYTLWEERGTDSDPFLNWLDAEKRLFLSRLMDLSNGTMSTEE